MCARKARSVLIELMTPSEAGELARRGVDLQLHTHRHRGALEEAVFAREVEDSRNRLRRLRASEATHFCYPGGVTRREFLPWLRRWNGRLGDDLRSRRGVAPP